MRVGSSQLMSMCMHATSSTAPPLTDVNMSDAFHVPHALIFAHACALRKVITQVRWIGLGGTLHDISAQSWARTSICIPLGMDLCCCTCRSRQEFRRLILRYGTNGVAESLRLEVFAPERFEHQFSGRSRKSLDIRTARSHRNISQERTTPFAPIAPI